MAKLGRDANEVNARILYWGCEGAGKSANLRAAFAKLRPDHRGEIKLVPTRIDPTLGYELLPIALGEIAGVRTQIEMIAVPGQPEQAPTRKQLLDQVDGIVFVADARPERAEANLASLRELRQSLAAYGRRIEQVPLVVQYNQRDRSDPYAIEDLHRRLALGNVPVFEGIAPEGTGVLPTLSTISKRVIRALRDQPPAEPEPLVPPPVAAGPAAEEELAGSELPELESSLELEPVPDSAEAAALLDDAWTTAPGEIDRPRGARLDRELVVVSVGQATRSGEREVSLPLVLGDRSGQTSTLLLTLRLDVLQLPDEPGEGA